MSEKACAKCNQAIEGIPRYINGDPICVKCLSENAGQPETAHAASVPGALSGGQQILMIGIGLVAVAGVCWYLIGQSTGQSPSAYQKPPDVVAKDGGDPVLAWMAAKEFVTKKLTAPSTAKFPFAYNSDGANVHHIGNGRYNVSGWVESQNALGATVRNTWGCTVVYEGEDKPMRLEGKVLFF